MPILKNIEWKKTSVIANISYHLMIIVGFAWLYYQFGEFDVRYTKYRKLSFSDCIYFSLTTQTTIGYGDIVPYNSITKGIVVCQMSVLLLLLIL